MVDTMLGELTLPAGVDLEVSGWKAEWLLMDMTSTKRRTSIKGSLSLSLSRSEGVVKMTIFQDVPMFWSLGVQTGVQLVCQDGLLLRPLHWDTYCATRSLGEEIEGTAAIHAGYVQGRQLHLSGVSVSKHTLPDTPLTSTWSLMAALPRIHQSGETALSFCLLDELLIPRPNQQFKRIGRIRFPAATGEVPLQGYRMFGTGVSPIHFWLNAQGWPVFITSMRRTFILDHVTAQENRER